MEARLRVRFTDNIDGGASFTVLHAFITYIKIIFGNVVFAEQNVAHRVHRGRELHHGRRQNARATTPAQRRGYDKCDTQVHAWCNWGLTAAGTTPGFCRKRDGRARTG